MENLLYISAIIAALAFLVLVIYLAAVLVAVKKTMNNVASTLGSLEEQMRGITRETEELLNRTNRLAEDINEKSMKLNGVLDGVKGIGETIQDFSMSLRGISTSITQAASVNKDQAAQAVKWGAAVMSLWKKKDKTL